MDLCDYKHTLRALFFARDRDITLQDGRNIYITNGDIYIDGGSVTVGNVPVGGIILWSGAIGSIPSGYALCDGTGGTPDLRDRFVIGAGSSYAVDATGGSTTKDVSHTHTDTFSVDSDSHSHADTLSVDSDSHSHGDTLSVDSDSHSHNSGTLATDSDGHSHTSGTLATDSDNHSHDVTGTSGSESAHTHGDGSYATAAPGAVGGHLTDVSGTYVELLSVSTFNSHVHDVTGTSGTGSSHSHSDGTYATAGDSHSHTVNSGSTGSDSHSHAVTTGSTASDSHSHVLSGSVSSDAHSHTMSGSVSSDAHSHNLSGLVGTGGSASQDIMPPYYALAYIMRTS